MQGKDFVFNRVGRREPFLIREVTKAIKEEQYCGLRLFGRMLIWQQKEDGLEGKETGSWLTRRLFQQPG